MLLRRPTDRISDQLRTLVAPAVLTIAVMAAVAVVLSMLTAPDASQRHVVHPGPVPADYIPIGAAPAVARAPAPGPAASTGSFTSRCGRNTGGHRNSDNFITAPGLSNGAHHVHDFVGNLSADRNSTDATLAAATTCQRGDKSVYFWPVLRDIRHTGEDAGQPGGGPDGNQGHILTPDQVTIDFLGNPQANVVPMPRFLRIVTGDAKAVTNGPNAPNAHAHWTCSGTPARASTTHYPLCPAGQLLQRTGEYPSCWNTTDTDSPTHRTHVTFPDPATGACPTATVPIPRLRITLGYHVPPGRSFALDSFPDQARNAVTDHFDFENVMPDTLMAIAVDCINTGRTC